MKVSNRFSYLMENNPGEEASATVKYGKFVETINTTNSILLSKKSLRKADDPASDPRVQEARRKLTLARNPVSSSRGWMLQRRRKI